MRIRTIKPEWLDDEALVLASSDARTLSIALILLADDYGNGRANEAVLSGRVFPGKVPDVLANALAELAKARFVVLYECDGQRYFSVRNWTKHQKVDKPGKPQVPGFVDVSKSRETSENIRVVIATDQDQDQEGTGMGAERTCAPVREAHPEAPRPRPADPMRRALTPRPTAEPDRLGIADAERAFSEARQAARRGRYAPQAGRDDERLAHLAKYANDGGTTRAERLAVLNACIAGYLADTSERVTEARWPLAWLAADPGRYDVPRASGGVDPELVAALAAQEEAEEACRAARLHRDAVAGTEAHSEASRAHLAKQRALADAKDRVERLSA